MAASSKKELDLLIRLGALEKLVDKLMDRLAVMEASVKGTESNIGGVLQIVQKMQEQTQDEWEIPQPKKEDKDDETLNDDVAVMNGDIG